MKNLTYERHFVKTTDKTTNIPISLIFRKDLIKKRTRNTPTILYARGVDATGVFTMLGQIYNYLPLLDEGMVLAIAHIRGGHEYGTMWEYAGKGENKQNSYDDLVACAEYLIQGGEDDENSERNLVLDGALNQGLAIATLINQRPDLFKVAAVDQGFIDLLTRLTDDKLFKSAGRQGEFGNPMIQKDFETMIKYAPLQNIKQSNIKQSNAQTRTQYPHIFASISLKSSSEYYWESVKWIAALREEMERQKKEIQEEGDGLVSEPDIVLTMKGTGDNADKEELAKRQAFILHKLGLGGNLENVEAKKGSLRKEN